MDLLRTEVEIVRLCPECAAKIVLTKGTLSSELVECPECGFGLEVVFFDPSNKAGVQRILKDAAGLGPKEGKTKKQYDVSKLDLSASPAVIPEPFTEEDFGE